MTIFFLLNQGFVDKLADVLGTSIVKSDSGIYLVDLTIIRILMDQSHKLTLLLISLTCIVWVFHIWFWLK